MLRQWVTKYRPYTLPLMILSASLLVVCAITMATVRNRQGDSVAATTVWRVFSNLLPSPPEIAFNNGVTLYRRREYRSAATEFLRASRGKGTALSAAARYNLGNALLRQGDTLPSGDNKGAAEFYRQAIVWYGEAARLDGADQDTRFNLAVARRRLLRVSSSFRKEKPVPGTERRKEKGSEGEQNREQTARKKSDASKMTHPVPGNHTGSTTEGGDDGGNGTGVTKPFSISRRDAEALLREQRQPGGSAALFRDSRKPGQPIEVLKDW